MLRAYKRGHVTVPLLFGLLYGKMLVPDNMHGSRTSLLGGIVAGPSSLLYLLLPSSMPLKTTTMVSKEKGTVSLSKRAPMKSAKKTIPSVVTPPALDSISVVWDNNVCRGDVSLDLTSHMDMLADFSNKVNRLEQAT